MVPSTRFTERASVDAWDRWFRWRNGDGVRDRNIDATWWRVADAVTGAVGDQDRRWAYRYVEAFSRWQMLPDEQLLRAAGTGLGFRPLEAPRATLNVAAFVTAPLTTEARFDAACFADVAAVAVRFLDDAQTMLSGAASTFSGLRIGLFGLADALELLGIPYEHPLAADQARVIGKALATGALRGSAELSPERGPIDARPTHMVTLWRDRGMADELIQTAVRTGVRHARLTAIGIQPRLALLANDVSDALDPPPPSRGRRKNGASADPPVTTPDAAVGAQLAIRAAIQPWIDEPIDYPITAPGMVDAARIESFTRLAHAYGVCEPAFLSNG